MPPVPQVPDNLLRRLELPVMRRLEGLLQGDYRSPSRGDGLDLADLREYQFHDDVRRIDWNATARLGVPYVRDYLEDREVSNQPPRPELIELYETCHTLIFGDYPKNLPGGHALSLSFQIAAALPMDLMWKQQLLELRSARPHRRNGCLETLRGNCHSELSAGGDDDRVARHRSAVDAGDGLTAWVDDRGEVKRTGRGSLPAPEPRDRT